MKTAFSPAFFRALPILGGVLLAFLSPLAQGAERVLLAQPAGASLLAAKAGDPVLAGKLATLQAQANASGSVRLIVGVRAAFAPEGDLPEVEAQNQRFDIGNAQAAVLFRLTALRGVKKEATRFETIPFMALEANAGELAALIADRDVLSIEVDALHAATLAESSPLIGATTAWGNGYNGNGQVVAVLDTGVDKTHAFLSGKVISEACYSTTYAAQSASSVCPGGVSSSTASGSGVNCGSNCDHGTHVAGIVAGAGASFSGVARGASLIAVQVFSRFNSTSSCGGAASCVLSYTSDQIKGLERVYALRSTYSIAAVNMSIGGGRYYSQATCDGEYASFKTAVDNLRAAGIATVISSGNNAYTNSMSAPGCVSSAVSVGSTWDAAGLSAGFSSCSEAASTVNKVACYSNSVSFLNLLAPGSAINSSIPGGGYSTYHGTSMAAPQVAGAWAVLKQVSPGLSVSSALSTLSGTGVSVTDYRNGVVKPRIDLSAALASLGASGSVVQFDSPSYAVNEGTTATLTVVRSGSTSGTSTVNYVTSAQTATAGVDYTITSGTLTFSSGQTSKTINVPTTADGILESNESFQVLLSGASSGTTIGANAPATVTLRNWPEGFGGSLPNGWKKPVDANSIWGVASDAASEGSYSLRSGAITHGQKSGIEYSAHFKAGTVSFDYLVSSEKSYDYLAFYIDGVLRASWSDAVGWANHSVSLSAGHHTLSWVYQKDGSISSGSDAAWIDNVRLPATTKPGTPWLMLLLD